MHCWRGRNPVRDLTALIVVLAATSSATAQTTSGNATAGGTLYNAYCNGCHGATVGSSNPPIKNAANAGGVIATVISNGMAYGTETTCDAGGISSYSATCNPGGISALAAASPIVVTGLNNGMTDICSVAANNAAGTGPASNTVMVQPVSLAFTGLVQSRNTHGSTDDIIAIDAMMPNTGAGNVEPRAIGAATASFAGNELIVTLTSVPDDNRATVRVSGANGAVDASASMGFLVGDVNGNGAVNAADISAVKAQVGQTVGGTSFRYDLNVSNTISNADVSVVKARSGLVLP